MVTCIVVVMMMHDALPYYCAMICYSMVVVMVYAMVMLCDANDLMNCHDAWLQLRCHCELNCIYTCCYVINFHDVL